MASTSEIRRPPNGFLLFKGIFTSLFQEKIMDPENITNKPEDYPHALPYNFDDWIKHESNSALVSRLLDRMHRDQHEPPDDKAAVVFQEPIRPSMSAFCSYAGKVWRSLDEKDTETFFLYQEHVKVVHTTMYPNFVFTPRPRKRKGEHGQEAMDSEAPAPKRRKTKADKTKPARVYQPRTSRPRSAAATTTKPPTRTRQHRAKRAPAPAHADLPTPSSSSASPLGDSVSAARAPGPGPVTPTAASPSPPTCQPAHLPTLVRNANGSYQTPSPYSNYGSFDSASRSAFDTPFPVLHSPHSHADFDKRYSLVPPAYTHWTGTGTPSSSASSLGGSPHGIAPASLPFDPFTSHGGSSSGYNVHASYANNVSGLPCTSHGEVNSNASPPSPLSPLSAILGLVPGGIDAGIDVLDMNTYGFDATTVGMDFGMDAFVPGFDGFEADALDYNLEANGFGFDIGAPALEYDLGLDISGNGGAYFAASTYGLEMTDFAFDANALTANFGA